MHGATIKKKTRISSIKMMTYKLSAEEHSTNGYEEDTSYDSNR